MRNAKKTLSLVMVAIFTTFIVLSGIPAGAVTTAQAKAQVSKATAAVVKVEKFVKVASFNPTTATTLNTAATKEVAKVRSLGKTYTKTYISLVARYQVVNKKIAARKAAIARAAAALKKLYTDAEKAVAEAEKLTDADNGIDLVGDEEALASAQGAVTAALEYIVKLDKNSSNYKGLMARIDAANNVIVKAMDDKAAADAAAAEAKAAEEAAAKAAEEAKAAAATAEAAVAAVEKAPLTTADEVKAIEALQTAATTAIAAVKDTEAAAAFTARMKVVAEKVTAANEKLAADAKAAEDAKKPATIAAVTAVDKTITVNFSKKPLTTPAAADFVVTKAIGTAAATTVTAVTVTVVNDTQVTLAVPEVAATTADQSVVYAVAYNSGAAVAAAAYTIAMLPTPTATVATTNNKTFVVTFNQEMDETAVETLANYTYTGGTTLAAAPVLGADKKTLTFTLTGNEAQQAKATLAMANLKSAVGVAMASTTLNITYFDTVVPTALSATLTAPTKVQIKFSEPITATAFANTAFSLDNNTYSLSGAPVLVAGTLDTLEVTLGSVLPAGNHTLVVNQTGTAANNQIKDFAGAGFVVPTATLTFAYAADTTLPAATLTSISQKKAVITFSKQVSMLGAGVMNTDFTVYHTFNKQASYIGNAVLAADGVTLNVTFNAPIAPGNATIFINNTTDTTKQLVDGWGNAVASTSLSGTVAADTTAPSVVSAVKVDSTHIDVTFSEAVNNVTALAFSLKNVAGSSTAISNVVNTTGYTYRLTLATAMNGDTYTLAIPASTIYDNGLIANYLPAYSTAFVVADTSLPTVNNQVICDLGAANGTKIKVSFSKVMATSGAGSVLDLNNYIWSGGAFPAGTAASIADNGKAVIITFPAATTLVGTTITVGRVADTLGNFTAAFSTAALAVATADVAVANFMNPMTVSTTVVTVEVDTPLTAIDSNLFTVNNNPVISATYVNKILSDEETNGAVITLTVAIANKWATSATPAIAITGANALTTSFGTKNSAAVAVGLAADATAPALLSAVTTDPNTLTLTYSEALYAPTVGIFTYTVAGNTITNATLAGAVVTLTLGTAITTDAVPAITQALAIQDNSVDHNVLAASTTAFNATDSMRPVITSATLYDGTTNAVKAAGTAAVAGDYILVVFSEAITAATVDTTANVASVNNADFTLMKGVVAAGDTALNAGTTVTASIVNGKTIKLLLVAVDAADASIANAGTVAAVSDDVLTLKLDAVTDAATTPIASGAAQTITLK